MKAYLVLDLAVHDFTAFKVYIDRIPAFIARHGGRYIVQARCPHRSKAIARPSAS
ncbi:DUF1330 domain-containing protein [Bradyrhizobium oligotrophicum S58]